MLVLLLDDARLAEIKGLDISDDLDSTFLLGQRFFLACNYGNLGQVKELLSLGADINFTSYKSTNGLMAY